MVELPNGKMKSREGTVVDADDLIATMVADARQMSADKVNKLEGITEEEAQEIARIVGMGALKYFILKVDARKNMLFNPEESIDFNGNTGPFIQYTYARIRSIKQSLSLAPCPLPLAPWLWPTRKSASSRSCRASRPQSVRQAPTTIPPASPTTATTSPASTTASITTSASCTKKTRRSAPFASPSQPPLPKSSRMAWGSWASRCRRGCKQPPPQPSPKGGSSSLCNYEL